MIRDLAVSRGDRPVLAGLSATFPRGRVTAVTRPSGTGKSSLLQAILGQLPAEGTVGWVGEIDAPAPRAPLPTEIAWAGQRPGLVAGTVRGLSLIHNSGPTREEALSYGVFRLLLTGQHVLHSISPSQSPVSLLQVSDS
ncbi:ABC transporter ATP-binding protein, partial [Clavibacter michiganensis]|uniref:ABC transporter ATP-binding protein n=1 Tax=Clavibacter michiganensis TaxID=28447 RepID=UPI00292D9DCC